MIIMIKTECSRDLYNLKVTYLNIQKEILNTKVLKSIDDTVAPKSRLCVSIMLRYYPLLNILQIYIEQQLRFKYTGFLPRQ